jgi:RNA polymerase sigma factor (sigma-70 family)
MATAQASTEDSPSTAPKRAELDESELVRRAQLGSATAFEQLVLARGPQLYRYLAARLRNDADARDALQETLTAAWLGLPRLKEPSRFWPWLCGIAAHKAADAVRGRIPVSERHDEVVQFAEGDVRAIRDAVATIPEHLQQVLLLRYLVGLSEREVAAALGIRVGTVKSRSARARTAFMEVWR